MQNYTWTISHSLFLQDVIIENIFPGLTRQALLQNKPDSALTILKQLRQEGSQAEQARYALLYSEALDKNHIKVTDDSLIRQAWSHYKHYSKIYDTNVRLSIIGDESNYRQETNREHCAFFSK